MDNLKYKEFYTRNLLHFQPAGAIFAVIFRLAFSLPFKIKEKLRKEKKEFEKNIIKLSWFRTTSI